MPHFGHFIALGTIEVMVAVLAGVGIGVLAMSSRSVLGTGGRDTGVRGHTARDIDPPSEALNMSYLVALDRTQ